LYYPGSTTALVSDTKSTTERYTPYQRPPQSLTITSAIPRGLRSFLVRGSATDAKPITDDYLLSISWTLPGGFAYLMNELHCNLQVDTASDFTAFAHVRMSNTSKANADFDYRIPIDFPLFSQNGSTLGVRGTQVPSGVLTRTPIIPPGGVSTASFSVTNLAAPAQVAGNVDFVVSFWEFDLEQAVYFPLHSALGVLPR